MSPRQPPSREAAVRQGPNQIDSVISPTGSELALSAKTGPSAYKNACQKAAVRRLR